MRELGRAYTPSSRLGRSPRATAGETEPVQNPGPANFGNLLDAMSAPGQSFFALKVTYWLAI